MHQPSPPISLALLGAGTFPKTAHRTALTALLNQNLIQIPLIWSRTKTSADTLATFYPSSTAHYLTPTHPTPLHSARIALSTQPLSAIILALPPSENPIFVDLALKSTLHILLEKPLALTVAHARSILSKSAQHPALHVAVAENFRFEPAFRHARCKLLQSSGSVLAAHLAVHAPMPKNSRYGHSWRLALPGPGILLDGGVHYIAALRVVLDADVQSVSATCSRRAGWFDGCDTACATLQFEGGVDAGLFVTYACNTFLWRLTVVGTLGDVVVERVQGLAGYRVSVVKNVDGKRVEEAEEFPFAGVDAEFTAFVESCRTGKLHPDLDARVAFNDLATIEAMFQSSEQNAPVPVAKYTDSPPSPTVVQPI